MIKSFFIGIRDIIRALLATFRLFIRFIQAILMIAGAFSLKDQYIQVENAIAKSLAWFDRLQAKALIIFDKLLIFKEFFNG